MYNLRWLRIWKNGPHICFFNSILRVASSQSTGSSSYDVRRLRCISTCPTSEICTITMELDTLLFVPIWTYFNIYYTRQLSIYNLIAHVADDNEAHVYVWNETNGFRGSNEIVSCLLNTWIAIFLLMFLAVMGIFTENTIISCRTSHKNRHLYQIERIEWKNILFLRRNHERIKIDLVIWLSLNHDKCFNLL